MIKNIYIALLIVCIARFLGVEARAVEESWLTTEEIDRIKAQLKIDEDYVTEIYLDSEDKETFGIGHLITTSDPEYGQPVGTKISEQRIDTAFAEDFKEAATITKDLFPKCTTWPSEVKEILVNMAFNLGGNLSGFKKMATALENRDWNTAADEMVDSKWYRQVKDRAKRLVARMRAVEEN